MDILSIESSKQGARTECISLLALPPLLCDCKGGGMRVLGLMQEKLVNFMAPKRLEEPAIASQLFRNLFARNK